MKKLTFLLVLFVLLFFTIGVSAQDAANENMKIVGGVTYNTFDGTISADGMEDQDLTENNTLGSGFGFYVGGQYFLSGSIGIEAGYDVAKSSDSENNETVDNSVKGPYSKIIFNINDNVMLNGGIAYYSNEIEVSTDTASMMLYEGSGIGFLLGGELNFPLNDKISLIGSGNYRFANLNLDKVLGSSDFVVENPKINMSGFSLRSGVSFKF